MLCRRALARCGPRANGTKDVPGAAGKAAKPSLKPWHGKCDVPGQPRRLPMKRDAEQALTALMKPMKRDDVTDLIVFRKMKSGLKWPAIAKKVGASKEWTAAA